MLAQLIYVSDRKADCTEKEIGVILEACQRNNPALGITGVLLYNEKKFLQLVEGDYKVLLDTYDKIKKDSRHEKCVMLSCAAIKEKSFPTWNMGVKKVDGMLEILTEISKDEKAYLENLFSGQSDESTKTSLLIQKMFR